MSEEKECFTKQMRKATRDVHAVSDALVNAKLVFALSDPQVWADGILVFYEVFRYLEDAALRLPDTPLSTLLSDAIQRKHAFEEDLNFYLTNSWKKDYKPRDSVEKYLLHLQQLEETDPDMLMAYVYHLYMGLLSGGQILKKKRQMFNQALHKDDGGYAVTNFGEHTISKLKSDLKATMNSIASELEEDVKERLIAESRIVFSMNNTLISSVRGTTAVLVKKLATVCLLVLPIIAFTVYWVLKK